MRHRVKPEYSEAAEHTSTWWALTRDERDDQNRTRSARRAGQELRRKIRHADLRRLLTFTNGAPGGWGSMCEALRHVLDWYVNHGGAALLGHSPMVAVPERGGRNLRIHVHAAIRKGIYLDYQAIIASWSAYLTAQGYTSTSNAHRWHAGDDNKKHANGFSSARVCADYMAKYLAKAFESDDRAMYEKRYRVVGVTVPPPRRVYGLTLGEVEGSMRDTFDGRKVECHWFEDSDGNYGGWFIEVSAPGG